MSEEMAELSSLGTALGDLTRRVAGLAEQAAQRADDEVSSELFAVERALRGRSRERVGRRIPSPALTEPGGGNRFR